MPTQTPPRLAQLERRLIESFDRLWDNFVDPADALYDTDGTRWHQLPGPDGAPPAATPFADEATLANIRHQCRQLATHNEFAINGHERHVT